MEKLEIINEFVEGELPLDKEEEFFNLLSSDSEARTELKHLLAMKDAVRSDSIAFSPSAKSTVAIFSQLGMTPPPTIQPIPHVTKFSKFKDFCSGFGSKSLYSGLASAGLTAAAFVLFFLSKNTQESHTITNNNKIEKQSIEKLAENIPVTKSTELPSSANQIVPKERIVYKYIVLANNKSNVSDLANATAENSQEPVTTPIENSNDSNNPLTISQSPDIAQNNLDEKLNSNTENTTFPEFIPIMEITSNREIEDFSKLLTGRKNIGLTVAVKGSQYTSSLNETVATGDKQPLNNTAINVLYDVAGGFSIGVDYSRESFYQKFEGRELLASAERYFEYEQNPNFETIGIAVRYMPSYASYGFARLFSQAVLGGNKVGYVGRFMLGTELEPIRNYSIIVGYDMSSMLYAHQSKWFVSNKRGLQIGAAVKF